MQKFDDEGNFLAKFGSKGTATGQFEKPKGIALDGGGNLWVADAGNDRVQEFDSEGQFIQTVGESGTGAGQFGEPTDIEVGPEGNVWVTDWANNRVTVFDADGDFAFQFGVQGSGPGQFKGPDAVDVDEQGNVWVVDQDNQRVQRFDISGEYVDQFGVPGAGAAQFSFARLMGVFAADGGDLWITDNANHRVQKWQMPGLQEAGAPVPEDDPAIEVETDGGLVEALDGEEAGQHAYEYSGGDLVSHDGPEGETTYEYDGAGRMTKVTLPNGTWGSIAYESLGRVSSVTVKPAGEAAKTTDFVYTDAAGPGEARRTTVYLPDDPHVVYDIGADGSVFKWRNVDEPPELDLAGTLYDNREEDGALFAGDHLLEAEAYSPEGIDSIEVIVNGDVLVDEWHCPEPDGPGPECVNPPPINQWVLETQANAPGHLSVEVIATSGINRSTSERFWVDIPQPPPPLALGTPVPPKFYEIKRFREEYGLEVVFPVANEIELNERIFDLITAWWTPWTPAGEVAQASYERWGVPLRPADVAEMEYREWLLETNGALLDSWYESTKPSGYAGYYIDHKAGGKFLVGFTHSQTSGLTAMKSSLPLVAQERLGVFPVQPLRDLQTLDIASDTLVDSISTTPELDASLVDLRVDTEDNVIVITTHNVEIAESAVTSIIGGSVPVSYVYAANLMEEVGGRFRDSGRMLSGDRVFTIYDASGCTAGFGTHRLGRRHPNGKRPEIDYLLTAGHCSDSPNEAYFRSDSSYGLNSKRIGRVAIDLWTGGPNFAADAEAIRLEGSNVVPRNIYTGALRHWGVRPAKQAFVGDYLCYSGSAAQQPNPCGKVIGRAKGAVKRPNGRRSGGYWVGFDRGAFHKDSGAPVFKTDGSAIGLVIGRWMSDEGRLLTLVEPLLHPPNMRDDLIPGVLHEPGMDSMYLSTGLGP